MGKGIRVPPVSLVEIDRLGPCRCCAPAGVCVFFREAGRGSIGGEKSAKLLKSLMSCGRVTALGKTIEEADQRQAVNIMWCAASPPMVELVRKMTRPQLTVAPVDSISPWRKPYAIPAMNHGTVKNAVRALEERRQIEGYGDHYAAASPLVTMKSLEPATLAEKLSYRDGRRRPRKGKAYASMKGRARSPRRRARGPRWPLESVVPTMGRAGGSGRQ